MTLQVSAETLHAIRRILVAVRTMGYDGVDSAIVAAIMDDAEYLPTILIGGEACPNEFGEYLFHMAHKWAEFTGIAEGYANAKTEPSVWLQAEIAQTPLRFASCREDFNTEIEHSQAA